MFRIFTYIVTRPRIFPRILYVRIRICTYMGNIRAITAAIRRNHCRIVNQSILVRWPSSDIFPQVKNVSTALKDW